MTSKPAKTTLLFGLHPCLAALKNPKRIHHRVLITRKTFEALSKEDLNLIKKIRSVDIVDTKDISQHLAPHDVHQGIMLETSPLTLPSLEELLETLEDTATLLLLDQVTDPHNVGALLRSAAAFDVKAILIPDYHSAHINGTLAKCASGALEHVPLITVGNFKQTMSTLKQEGFWCVGLDERGHQDTASFQFDQKTALILGAEGKGLRPLTKKNCDVLLKLPTGSTFQTLNVSNAGAITLYEIFCQSTNRRK